MNSCRDTAPWAEDRRPEQGVAALMRRYVHGDDRAFTRMHATLRPRLRRAALRFVGGQHAEDMIQLAFLRAHRAARSFAIPARDADRAIVGWFQTILRHVVVDHWRRQRTETQTHERYANGPAPELVLLDDALIRYQREATLHASIDALPRAKRRLIERRMAGDTFSEIGRELGVSSGAARVRAHRLYRELAARVAAHETPLVDRSGRPSTPG